MSQRTKGNVKPSNSERTARLLTSNQFLSFSQASQSLSDVYANSATSSNDSSSFQHGIDSDFQVIFKHMTKKDINTKLKALQDFTALCSTKEKSELLQTASYWYRIYRKLSNVIDWRVRQEIHNAHYNFISKFDKDEIIDNIQALGGANANDTDGPEPSGEVSFQNLVTMPAIMWVSCFDVYSQSTDSAKKTFNYLYPTDKCRIEFLLENYEAILNYCAYCIFDKIPIKLFYSNPLPADSAKVFEEHLLVTTLRGLSTLVNELASYYLEIENSDDESMQRRVYGCLEQIFSRVNTEFGKSKFAHINKTKPAQNDDEKNTQDEAFLSKKDKKKLRKEEKDKDNANKDKEKGARTHCKFWIYFSSDYSSIRVSFFHALNSITRLTSIMFDNSQLKESSIYEQLNTHNQLWFKLYRNNLYESLFKSFVDPVPDIRGFAWLLGTHMLTRPNQYKPWLVVNHDKWLQETLVAFISNGMKTVGGIIDFGLFNIGLANYKRLYPEFFAKKYSQLSGLQLTCDNYSDLDILANVKLVIAFADAFNSQEEFESSLKIFQTFLFALKDAFDRVVLQKDLDFLIEIYFNLIYHFVNKCLQLPSKASAEQLAKGNFVEEVKINFLFDQIFQTHLYNLLVNSIGFKSMDLLFNSQIYLSLLLLVNNITDHYKENFAQDASKETLQVINLFKFNVQKLYSRIFAQIDSDLNEQIVSSPHPKYQLNRILRFLNDSILLRPDGYFSSEFYYAKGSTNYSKNALKQLRSSINSNAMPGNTTAKRVNFCSDDDDDNKETQIQDSTNWWSTRLQQSTFSFSLQNEKYCERSKRVHLSLLGEYSSLFDELSPIMVKLIQLFDSRLTQSELLKGKASEEELFLIVQHIQYILRSFNGQQLAKIFTNLQGSSIDSAVNLFVQTYLSKWIDSIYKLCSKLDNEKPNSGRFQVLICSKIYDILVVCLAAQNETTSTIINKQILSKISPFAFCVLFRHVEQLSKLPMSSIYPPAVAQLRLQLAETAGGGLGSLVNAQIEVLFQQSSHSKVLDCDILINLLQILLQSNAEPQTSQLCLALTLLLQHLKQYDQNGDNFEQFLLELPLLCRENYEFLFKNVHSLARMENFESTLMDLTKFFFRKMFKAATVSTEDKTNLTILVANSSAFIEFIFDQLFKTLPIYETSLKQLAQDLISIVTDGIIQGQFCGISNHELINQLITQFLDVLCKGFKSVSPQMESSEIVEIGKTFSDIQINFVKAIAQKTDLFMQDNIFASLYELEKDTSALHRLYVIYDLYLSEENVQILEKFNNSDNFNQLLESKLSQFDQSLYSNNYFASIIRNLLENIYLDSTFKEQLNFNASLLAKTDQSPFDLLPTIRTLVINLYNFERFLSFYFTQGASSAKQTDLRNICAGLRKQIECILALVKNALKTTTKDNSNAVVQFIQFLISSLGSQDILGLSYANFVVSNFFPTTHWMDILNYFGLPAKLNISKVSKITCLMLAHCENVTKITEVVSQALRHFESAAISESYNEPKAQEETGGNDEVKKENLVDWLSKLSTDQINQILLVVDFAFCQVNKLSSVEQKDGVAELTERLHNFLTLLAWGKLENLFQSDVPQFSHPKYLTFLLSTQLIASAFNENSKPDHFAMYLALLKLWIQIMYTTLPESIEKGEPQRLHVLVMSSQMFDTLNQFGQKASALSSENDAHLEMVEMWRNFLAFNSFNMLLPLFVVLNNSPNRNLIERTYLKRLVKTMDFVDMECLEDISTLELNQYLLMIPDENSNQRTLQTMLNNFIENAHLSKASDSQRQNAKRKISSLALSPSSPYYEYILTHVTPLLLHSDFDWSLSAFQLLSIMFQDLPWSQKGKEKPASSNINESMLSGGIDTLIEKEDIRLVPPQSLSALLEKLDGVTEFILNECEFGQSVMIDQSSDVYDYAFAYLLVWLLYLHLMDPFPMEDQSEIRSNLIDFLTERNLHSHLFDNLFHIMLNIEEEVNSEETVQILGRIRDLNEVQNLRELIGERDSHSLSRLALCVYYQALRYLPNLLRSWFNNLSKPQHKNIVDEFTMRYFSDLLIEKELDNFRLTDRDKFGNIVIRTSKKANEITAVYSLREISFGIKFTFKANYPLTAVGIECFNRSGVSEDRCRKWIHRLTTFFNKQNCSILNGIILLRPNMDKFFEDIEECMICLFVLYGATSDLPRFKCPQCRKKFHWACIRKWFQTNNNNMCPMCKFEFK